MTTLMPRTTTCNGCGFTQSTHLSYRQDRKLWEATHTLAFCQERKRDQEISDMVDYLFCGPR